MVLMVFRLYADASASGYRWAPAKVTATCDMSVLLKIRRCCVEFLFHLRFFLLLCSPEYNGFVGKS